jgi:hypothetical protein
MGFLNTRFYSKHSILIRSRLDIVLHFSFPNFYILILEIILSGVKNLKVIVLLWLLINCL